MAYEYLLRQQSEGVAILTLNRPEKQNALSQGLMAELRDVLDAIDCDSAVRVVLLTGAGRAFSSGFDLSPKELAADTPQDEADWNRLIKLNFDTLMRIWHLRQPVVAAVNGPAIAAGSNLALICDITIAANTATFGEPEIRHFALSPLLLLPYFANNSKAMHYLYYSGDTINADEALKLGLVSKVVPLEQLMSEAQRIAQRIAKVPAYPVQITKRSIKAAYEMMGFKNAMELHRANDALVIDASQIEEKRKLMRVLMENGLRAFLELRDGPFRQ
ncbi:MAG TPA: enoyl-CoA hydratase/isomerase family protein [Methylomirabilota bacterium]|nr:enoyl-CoA hydratase/isomerase family protein [Methylomirabilota bacterium]